MTIALITHPTCALHEMGTEHPESPARLGAIQDQLIASGLAPVLKPVDAPRVSRAQLEAVHDAAYLDRLYAASPAQGRVQLDPDTALNPHSLEAAERAAGAGIAAVDLVLAGEVGAAFAAVRPPGHHAERARAMGFCVFSNIAVAAYHALDAHGLDRVAILDFDVHHGNGTEDIVSGDERILFCSTFQSPFYPYSGHDSDAPNVINSTLAAGSGSEAFRRAVREDWLGRLEEFAPQLLLVSAGFDAHQADAMAMVNLVDDDYAWVTEQIVRQAERSAEGRVVSMLEGGYELRSLGRCVAEHLAVLLGKPVS
ncbi:MAG: histone deacetylase family protein [Pseudomonadota bacterium]